MAAPLQSPRYPPGQDVEICRINGNATKNKPKIGSRNSIGGPSRVSTHSERYLVPVSQWILILFNASNPFHITSACLSNHGLICQSGFSSPATPWMTHSGSRYLPLSASPTHSTGFSGRGGNRSRKPQKPRTVRNRTEFPEKQVRIEGFRCRGKRLSNKWVRRGDRRWEHDRTFPRIVRRHSSNLIWKWKLSRNMSSTSWD